TIQATCHVTASYYGEEGVLLEKTGHYHDGSLSVRPGHDPAQLPVSAVDALGSERIVTDPGTQNVSGTVGFDAFGQTNYSTGFSENPYMFAATSGYCNDGDGALMQVGS